MKRPSFILSSFNESSCRTLGWKNRRGVQQITGLQRSPKRAGDRRLHPCCCLAQLLGRAAADENGRDRGMGEWKLQSRGRHRHVMLRAYPGDGFVAADGPFIRVPVVELPWRARGGGQDAGVEGTT